MDLSTINSNWIDLAVLFLIIMYLLSGWGRGFIWGLIDLGGFIISFICALKFYALVGLLLIDNFSLPKGIANASGFLIAGIISEMIYSMIAILFYRKIFISFFENKERKKTTFFRIDRFLSFIPVTLEALIFISFILTLLTVLPIQGSVKKAITTSTIGSQLVVKTQVIENKLNNIFGEAVNETLTFLTINASPISEEKVDLDFTTDKLSIDENAERTMLNLINQERGKAGLSHLSLSFQIRDLARDYARDMFEKGYFSHYNQKSQSPFDRMNERGINFLAAGENLALAPNVSLAHQGLMNSSGHRANILSPDFTKIGIGVIDGGIYGEMFVQEFTN